MRPGERAAKAYVTNLNNLTEPLIRYELTDEVTVLDEPCLCGITPVRIDDIQGRLDDCFAYPGGPTVHPFTFRYVSAGSSEQAIATETDRKLENARTSRLAPAGTVPAALHRQNTDRAPRKKAVYLAGGT